MTMPKTRSMKMTVAYVKHVSYTKRDYDTVVDFVSSKVSLTRVGFNIGVGGGIFSFELNIESSESCGYSLSPENNYCEVRNEEYTPSYSMWCRMQVSFYRVMSEPDCSEMELCENSIAQEIGGVWKGENTGTTIMVDAELFTPIFDEAFKTWPSCNS